MTVSFMLNQEVSETTLNDVAVDLGAASFSKFSNGVETAVSELNGITQALTSKGVLRSGNKCAPSYSNGAVNIAPGIAVFNTGAKRKLTESASIQIPDSDKHYVYFENDHNLNEIFLKASVTAPAADSDCVMLATVQNGTLSDAREWSTPKVTMASGEGAHSSETITCSFTSAEYAAAGNGKLIKSYSLKSSTYSVVSYYCKNSPDTVFGVCDLASGYSGHCEPNFDSVSKTLFRIYLGRDSGDEVYATAKVENGSISFYSYSSKRSQAMDNYIFIFH